MNNYELIILCGKAGAGKDYLLQQILKHYGNDINAIISDTTRPPRSYEQDGVDYNFLSLETFSETKHLEITSYEVGGDENFNLWLYGTPYSSLDKNKLNIGIFNVDGIRQIYDKNDIKPHIFYISADDRTRLIRQFDREEYPDYSEICRRFLADEKDFKNLYKYPFKKIRNSSGLKDDECVTLLIEEIDKIKSDFDKMS